MIGILPGPDAFFSFNQSMLFITPLWDIVMLSIGAKGELHLFGILERLSVLKTEVNWLFNRSALACAVSAIISPCFRVLIPEESCFLLLIYFQKLFQFWSLSGSSISSLISRTDKVELIATEFFQQSCDCLGYFEQHTKSCKSYLVGKYIYFRLKNDHFYT